MPNTTPNKPGKFKLPGRLGKLQRKITHHTRHPNMFTTEEDFYYIATLIQDVISSQPYFKKMKRPDVLEYTVEFYVWYYYQTLTKWGWNWLPFSARDPDIDNPIDRERFPKYANPWPVKKLLYMEDMIKYVGRMRAHGLIKPLES